MGTKNGILYKPRRKGLPYKYKDRKGNVFENIIAGYDRYNIMHRIERDLHEEVFSDKIREG